jgi:DNA-directed RNA polymerase subunit RPC12/RpoP
MLIINIKTYNEVAMNTYQCKRCGKVSSDKSQVCDTGESPGITSLYVCEDCNKQSMSAEAVCRPKEVTPSFYCKTCGSAASEKKSLCKPKALQV